MKDIEKNVEVLCPVCGNKMFENLNEGVDDLLDDECYRYKCVNCKRIFTKKELLDATIEEMKNDTIKEVLKELKKSFR